MYKSKFLQNALGAYSSKGSKVGFKDFEDTMPKEFSDMARSASTNQNVPNSSSKNLELELQPNSTIPQTYFGMSPYPCTKPHRLELFWSVLGDCIDYRK